VGVSIEQSISQADPAASSPIVFDVLFTDDVLDFVTGDVTVTTTSDEVLTGIVSRIGAYNSYQVSVPVTKSGRVTATIAAGVASAGGFFNFESSSIDNQVSFSAVETKVDALTDDVGALKVKLDDESRCKLCGVVEKRMSRLYDHTVTNDTELGLHEMAVLDAISGIGLNGAAVEAIQLGIEQVKDQVIEAHTHIEALIGQPSDIPSIDRRKRDGSYSFVLIIECVSIMLFVSTIA
jgi:hypothetical protein